MIDLPERSPERDAVITALLDQVPVLGWTDTALRAALAATGSHPDDASYLFPGGAADLVEAYCDLADRQMAEISLDDAKLSARVRRLIAARFEQQAANKEAVGRALAVLARPGNAVVAARCTARTVDAIWHAAGDTSADFSWYTKRAILGAIYGATLLFWLRDQSEDDADTLAFLDRRLASLGGIARLRRKIAEWLPARPGGAQPAA